MTLFLRARRPLTFVFALCLLANVAHQCQGALNVGLEAPEDMVTRLRQSIFVETKYLHERREEQCSSLDGPRCFAFMAGRGSGSKVTSPASMDGPGVIPELILQDLGVEKDSLVSTPDFNTLAYYHQVHEDATSAASVPKLLTGSDDALSLRSARSDAQQGVLHFADIVPNSRIPLTFSSELPNQVIATWDGRWIARDCDSEMRHSDQGSSLLSGGVPHQLALPALAGKESAILDPYAPILYGNSGNAAKSDQLVSTVAELSGSVGYLRFSRPVIVRSLLAQWQPSLGASPAIVGGRLGLDGIWTTHLDPAKFDQRQGWQDLGGDLLRPVDEIAFIGAPGLKIGVVDVVAYSGVGAVVEERSVLLLAPMSAADLAAHGMDSGGGPKFQLRLETLTPAAAPFVVSLQEAIDRNLKVRVPLPADKQASNERPKALSADTVMPRPGDDQQHGLVWGLVSKANQAVFEHQSLMHHPILQLLGAGSTSRARPLEALAAALANPSSHIPADLRKDLVRKREDIIDAVMSYLRTGGNWGRNTPSIFPQQGSEEAVSRYMTAKRWQTKFDLLTAGYLYTCSTKVLQEAQASLAKALAANSGAQSAQM